jgi:hypothetical protein
MNNQRVAEIRFSATLSVRTIIVCLPFKTPIVRHLKPLAIMHTTDR